MFKVKDISENIFTVYDVLKNSGGEIKFLIHIGSGWSYVNANEFMPMEDIVVTTINNNITVNKSEVDDLIKRYKSPSIATL